MTRKTAKIPNYKFIYAMLCIIKNGCKWRTLPKKYGKRHTIHMKFSRWSKNGIIVRAIAFLF